MKTRSENLNWLILLIVAALAFTSTLSNAAALTGHSTDFDLSGPHGMRVNEDVPLELKPDSIQTLGETPDLSIKVLREDHGKMTPVVALAFTTNSPTRSAVTGEDGVAHLSACLRPGTRTRVTATLKSEFFSVIDGDHPYSISFEVPCSGEILASFKSDSNGGQALGIWQIAQKAKSKLQASIGLGFWKSSLDFVWPANADYYSWGQVHISRGDHWDVVGHEMGHGIYDLGNIGQFGGGPHKIDECYSGALALSEGWASYFSSWVSLDLSDADAKFEYMVPRRSPIRFETIPADVCKGEKNEWRVIGFFWDLIDLHEDGEKVTVSFAQVWKALTESKASNATDALQRLERAGVNSELLHLVYDLNFNR